MGNISYFWTSSLISQVPFDSPCIIVHIDEAQEFAIVKKIQDGGTGWARVKNLSHHCIRHGAGTPLGQGLTRRLASVNAHFALVFEGIGDTTPLELFSQMCAAAPKRKPQSDQYWVVHRMAAGLPGERAIDSDEESGNPDLDTIGLVNAQDKTSFYIHVRTISTLVNFCFISGRHSWQISFYYAADICMLCYKPDSPSSLEAIRRLWVECPELKDPRVCFSFYSAITVQVYTIVLCVNLPKSEEVQQEYTSVDIHVDGSGLAKELQVPHFEVHSGEELVAIFEFFYAPGRRLMQRYQEKRIVITEQLLQ